MYSTNLQCQNIRYLILCTLLGLTCALPISDENNHNKNFRPAATSAIVKPNLLDTNLRLENQFATPEYLNSLLILEPIVRSPILFDTIAEYPNQRLRRTLTQAQLDEPVDVDFDMELDEVNVFRPLFRYRAEVARNLGQRQQFG